jgi:hypothetical protein
MIVFTVCSNNYLAEATSLGNSILDNTKVTLRFYIFLTDKYNENINYQNFRFPIIEVNEAICPGYYSITEKYDIIELSTAVKPSVFKYLMASNKDEELFYYFDPDIYFFSDIQYVNENFGTDDVILTPHVTKPMTPGVEPFENTFLNYGVFNLGFIGLKKSKTATNLLDWWEDRTMKMGVIAPSDGLFVDQLWINFVPVYFENVKISKHLGFNTAYWNISEREISRSGDSFLVNDVYPLVFFHFSSFDFTLNKLAKRHYTHPSYDNGILKVICGIYKKELEANQYKFYRQYKPFYNITYDAYLIRHFSADSNSKKIKMAERLFNAMPELLRNRFIRAGYILGKLREFKR